MFGQAVTDQLTGPCLPERYVSTNAIESMIGICCEHAKNVKHWRDGKMALRWCAALVRCAGALRWCAALVRCAGALRWCAAGMIKASGQFHRASDHLHRPALCAALERELA
jgi:putative transposase